MSSSPPTSPPPRSSLSMRIGGWFEACATGWGVVALPVVAGLVLAAAILRLWGS